MVGNKPDPDSCNGAVRDRIVSLQIQSYINHTTVGKFRIPLWGVSLLKRIKDSGPYQVIMDLDTRGVRHNS